MGWGSAGYEIFDPVARALVDAGAPDDVITNTCAQLINTLTNQDWDTLEDSIQEFADQPAVIAAFERVTPKVLARFREAVPELFGAAIEGGKVAVRRVDDEHLEILVNGTPVAWADHDQHGWAGMDLATKVAFAVARALGAQVDEGQVTA